MSRDRQAPQRREGWYRLVSTRLWGDERFWLLTDSAKLLWFHLITGPHTTALPGISGAGRAQLAETIRWPLKAFNRRFDEIAAQGMAKADWTARVLWLPKAVHHNPPDNPNVVRGWVKQLVVIPECSLKQEAIDAVKLFLEPFGEQFLQPFGERFPKQDQDQDQDQDQEQEQLAARRPVGDPLQAPPNKKGQPDPGFMAFWSAYPNKKAKPAAEKAWAKLKPPAALQRTILEAIDGQRQSADWTKDRGRYIPHPATYLNGRRWEDSIDSPAESAAGAAAFAGAGFSVSAKMHACVIGPLGNLADEIAWQPFYEAAYGDFAASEHPPDVLADLKRRAQLAANAVAFRRDQRRSEQVMNKQRAKHEEMQRLAATPEQRAAAFAAMKSAIDVAGSKRAEQEAAKQLAKDERRARETAEWEAARAARATLHAQDEAAPQIAKPSESADARP